MRAGERHRGRPRRLVSKRHDGGAGALRRWRPVGRDGHQTSTFRGFPWTVSVDGSFEGRRAWAEADDRELELDEKEERIAARPTAASRENRALTRKALLSMQSSRGTCDAARRAERP